MQLEPKHLLIVVGGGIVLIALLGWIVEHNAKKALENAQRNDPWVP